MKYFPLFSLIFTGFLLFSCTTNENKPSGGDEPTVKPPSPPSKLAKLKGRAEFLMDHSAVVGREPYVPKSSYTNRIIVKYKKGVKSDGMHLTAISALPDGDEVEKTSEYKETREIFALYRVAAKSEEDRVRTIKARVKELKAMPDVEDAYPEYIRTVQTQYPPNDPKFKKQWNFNSNFMNLTGETFERWEGILGSEEDIRICIVDTGYRPHKDLEPKVIKELGYDFIRDLDYSNDGNGIDSDPTDVGDPSNYHGTFVAGIAAGVQNNEEGIYGITRKVKVFFARVLGREGSGVDYDIAQGVRYCAGLPNDSGRTLDASQRAHVINLSLGGFGEAPMVREALVAARNNGVAVVCAAGNEYDMTPVFPAAYDECISVGALIKTEPDENYYRAEYSSHGINVDIMAPGGSGGNESDGIYSTSWSGRKTPEVDCREPGGEVKLKQDECSFYEAGSGTSYATPHVAAIVALMRSANPTLTPDGIASVLFRTAKYNNEKSPNTREFGYGIMDALSAISTAESLASMEDKIIVRLKTPDFKVVKPAEATSPEDYSFVFEGIKKGDYVIHAGTDYNQNGIICEKGEKFGIYPPKEKAAVFTVKEGDVISDIKVVLSSQKGTEDCPEG